MRKVPCEAASSILMTALLAAQAWAATPASLELDACRVPGVDETLRCGDLVVPENPQQPAGRKIELHVVVMPALDRDPSRAPHFDLAGGPGLPASSSAFFFATDGRIHRQHRDIVLVDQRGTGASSPLRCPELERVHPLSNMYPVDAVRRCRADLSARADLSQYHTVNSAHDLEAVRVALAYSRIDLSALSYGTRLVLVYSRLYPQRVRSAALIGTVSDRARSPLGHARSAQAALEGIFDDCAQAQACSRAFPDLPQKWHAVLERVQEGVTIEADGHEAPRKLAPGPFAETFRGLLLTARGRRRAPLSSTR